MFPQTMFFVAANPECPCPPTIFGAGVVLGSQITNNIAGNTNNLTIVGINDTAKLLLTSTGDVTITGLAAPANDGQMLYIWNVDQTPNTITLSHADVLSLAANRFYLPGAIDLVLGQYDGVMLSYTQSLNGGVGGWLAIPG